MAFEDALRDVTSTLAMTFNPQVEMERRKVEENKRQSAIEQLSQGIQSGAIDPVIGNQRLQQLGGQAVGPNQLTLDRQQQLAEQQRQQALNARIAPQLQQIASDPNLTPQQKQEKAFELYSQLEPQAALKAAAVPTSQLTPTAGGDIYQVQRGVFGPQTTATGLKAPPKGVGGTGSESGKIGLSSDAIDKLADEYHQTGSLPSLGMAAKGDKEAIINRERSKYPTSTGGDMVVNRTGYKANSMGLNSLTKDIVAIAPYKKMLDTNVDIAIDLSKKVVMSDSKVANKSINWVKQNMGDNPDAAEYLAQMRFVQTEAARVLNNPRLVGQLTDTARKEMEEVISGDMPIGASTRVLQRIKKDGENRVAAMVSAQNELSKKLGGSTVTPEKKDTSTGWSAKIVR